MNLVKKIKKFAKKKRRRTSEIYQSNDVDVESGGNDVNYVRGIGQGAEADRGKDGRRRSNLVVNRSKQINEDDVDSPAKPTEKRIKQDYDVNSLLAGSVLDPSPRVGQTFKSSSKGVHYSPRSPGVIMEDLEDQVSKQYTEGFVTSDPEELHEQENADGDSKRSRLNMEGELNKEKVPVTPNMKIRRYENYGEVGDGSLSARNQSNYFQRLNRKSKKMTSSRQTKSAESASSLPELKKRGMSEDKYRRLLEELYPDKKYFDHTKKTCLPSEEHLSNKTNEGLEYLHGVAEYWEKQEPLKRPQSTPSKSRGPKSARTQKRSRQGSSLSRNLSMHSPETTSHGLPPDVS